MSWRSKPFMWPEKYYWLTEWIDRNVLSIFSSYWKQHLQLGRSILFNEWCSPNESDMAFGSLGAFWKVDLTGKNCLLVCTRNDSVDLKNINEKIQLSVNSKQPTRILLVIPSELLQEMALPPRKILSIAESSTNFPLTRPEEVEGTRFNASEATRSSLW